jgi:hypothetical protein
MVTHYTIRTGNELCHPKSWVVEVSVDGENWAEIDHKENFNELNGKSRTRIFQVKGVNRLEKPKTQLPVNFPPNYCSSLIEQHKIKSFQEQRSVKAFYQKDTSEIW